MLLQAHTATVMAATATRSVAVTSISASATDMEGLFGTALVTLNNHGLTDGQQINVSGGSFQIDSSAYTEGTFTARNTTTNTFELFDATGDVGMNVTSFSSAPTIKHTTLVFIKCKRYV